jgi:hypothetical protein
MDLEEEHGEGLHDDTPNVSCGKCKPRRQAEFDQSAHGRYARELLSARVELTSMQYHSSRSSEKPQDVPQRPQSTSAHSACDHERSSKARAKCRARRKKVL